MIANDILEPLIGPTVAGLGYELLGIERQRSGDNLLLRLYIDSPTGIALMDCERVSKQIGNLLDAEQLIDGRYTLEVSSPGVDRPLFKLDHYQRFIGATVQVRLRALVERRRRLQGKLLAVDERTVSVECDDETIQVPVGLIERTRLVPTWEPNTKPASPKRGPKKSVG